MLGGQEIVVHNSTTAEPLYQLYRFGELKKKSVIVFYIPGDYGSAVDASMIHTHYKEFKTTFYAFQPIGFPVEFAVDQAKQVSEMITSVMKTFHP